MIAIVLLVEKNPLGVWLCPWIYPANAQSMNDLGALVIAVVIQTIGYGALLGWAPPGTRKRQLTLGLLAIVHVGAVWVVSW